MKVLGWIAGIVLLCIAGIFGLKSVGINIPFLDDPETQQWDPVAISEGTPWHVSNAVTQTRISPSEPFNLTYRHQPVISTFWADACDFPDLTQNSLTCADIGDVLVVATVTFDRDRENYNLATQNVDLRYFQRASDVAFTEIGKPEIKLERAGDSKRMKITGYDTFDLAEMPKNDAVWNSAEAGGGIANLDLASMGYHLARIKPRDTVYTGTERMIFCMFGDCMRDNRPKKWQQVSDKTIPFGLKLQEYEAGCVGGKDIRTVKSEEELMTSNASSWGLTILNFKHNEETKNTLTEMKSKKTSRVSAEVRCSSHALSLDMARTELHPNFKTRISELSEACGEYNEDCKARLDKFVDTYGTHYTNNLGYGGTAQMFSELDEDETAYMNALEDQTTNAFSLTTGVSISAKPFGVGTSATTTFTNGFEKAGVTQEDQREFSRSISDKLSFTTRGGTGGSSFEGWSAAGTPVPIYVDLRPIDELLTPIFFSDPKIFLSLKETLKRHIEDKYPRASGYSTEIINPRRYKSKVNPAPPPPAPTSRFAVIPVSKGKDDSIAIKPVAQKNDGFIRIDGRSNTDDWAEGTIPASMVPGCGDEATEDGTCRFNVRHVGDDADTVVFEINMSGSARKYDLFKGAQGPFAGSLETRKNGQPQYIGLALTKHPSNGEHYLALKECGSPRDVDEACKWNLEAANINRITGGALAYYIRPAGSNGGDKGLRIVNPDQTFQARAWLRDCPTSRQDSECLWYLRPLDDPRKRVVFYESCEGQRLYGDEWAVWEGDHFFDAIPDKEGQRLKNRISGIGVSSGYRVRLDTGVGLNHGERKDLGPGFHCLSGTVYDNKINSVSVRRSSEKFTAIRY